MKRNATAKTDDAILVLLRFLHDRPAAAPEGEGDNIGKSATCCKKLFGKRIKEVDRFLAKRLEGRYALHAFDSRRIPNDKL